MNWIGRLECWARKCYEEESCRRVVELSAMNLHELKRLASHDVDILSCVLAVFYVKFIVIYHYILNTKTIRIRVFEFSKRHADSRFDRARIVLSTTTTWARYGD